MSTKDLTIIITTFKSEDKIRNCLNSINKDYKVINVENSNNLIYKEKIEKEFKNVECILSKENAGYGKANNIGITKVKTKYALILNPDTEIFPDTIDIFFKIAEEKKDFAIIQPNTITDKKNLNSSTQYLNQNNEGHATELGEKLLSRVRGHAMFINISQFENIGFFDEKIFFFLEETDLAKRLLINRKKIFFCESIFVFHEGGQSHKKNINHQMELSRNWHWMWSSFYYNKKYRGWFISLLLFIPNLLSSSFKFLIFFILKNNEKKEIYYQRLSGLVNSIIGKTSWFRPKV